MLNCNSEHLKKPKLFKLFKPLDAEIFNYLFLLSTLQSLHDKTDRQMSAFTYRNVNLSALHQRYPE